jgi:hypothetical protein
LRYLLNLAPSQQVEWSRRDGLENDLAATAFDGGAYSLDVDVLNAHDHTETNKEFPI